MYHEKVDGEESRRMEKVMQIKRHWKQVVGKQMGGTGVVCRSVRKRTMREIYSPHSTRRSAQYTLKALNSLTSRCYMAGERNLAPAPPSGSCPHLLLLLKCRTPRIFFPSTPLPVVGMSASSSATSFRAVNDPTAWPSLIQSFTKYKIEQDLSYPLTWVSDSAVQNHHRMEVVVSLSSHCYLVCICTLYISKKIKVCGDVL